MSPIVRLQRDERREQLLDAALAAARELGHYKLVRRSHVAGPANTSLGLVSHYLGVAEQMERAIMQHAVDRADLEVLAQGLLAGDPVALAAPEDLKQRVREAIR